MVTKLAYSVWRPAGRTTKSRNGTIIVKGDFNDPDFGHEAFVAITAKHPGWVIAGYSQIERKGDGDG